MTTNDASKKFGMDTKIISEACRMQMVPGAQKIKWKWYLPDGLELILTKKNVQSVLQNLLKLKNYGYDYPISYSVFCDHDGVKNVFDYIWQLGMIDRTICDENEMINVKLTEDGLKLVLKDLKGKNKTGLHVDKLIEVNVNRQIGVINTIV